MRQIYFSKLASAPAQEVFLKEYFSTAYDFDKVSLEKALDIYNGWRKSSFSTCNCQQLLDLSSNDFGQDITKFKGTCLKTKIKGTTKDKKGNVTEVGYMLDKKFISMQPESEPKPGEELLQYHRIIIVPARGKDKYSVRWDLDIVKEEKRDDAMDGQGGASKNDSNVTAYKRSPWLYIRTAGRVPKGLSGKRDEIIDIVMRHFRKCEIVIPQKSHDLGSNSTQPTFPLDLRNIYTFLRSDPNKENGKNEDFTPLAERERYRVQGRDGHDASPDSHNFWKNIADYPPVTVHKELKKLMTDKKSGLPHICKLLYNCLLFDFETADTISDVTFAGSRTTGRLRTNKFSSFKGGETFIQKSINTAIENFQNLKNKVNGLQTVSYQLLQKQGENETKIVDNSTISYSTTEPSVTSVLSAVRQYVVWYLLNNNMLKKTVSNKLNKKEGKARKMKTAEEFFDMGSRSEKESKEIQELNDSLLDQFIKNETPPAGQVETKSNDKLHYLRYVPKEIRDLPVILPVRFIVIGIILNQKTQGDEMQLHGAKAYKNLFPVDSNGLEVLYHVYSYDGVMGIKALRKGTSLLFQSDRGIQIALESKTEDPPGYTRLSRDGTDPLFDTRPPASPDGGAQKVEQNSCDDEIHGGFVNMNVKSPSQTLSTELVNLKDFTTENFSVLFDDLNVSSCSDLTPTQLEVNDIYGRLIDTHKKAILCYRRILYNIKNRYENDEGEKAKGYKILNSLFNEFDKLLNRSRGQEQIYHILLGKMTLRLEREDYNMVNLLKKNYEVNLDNGDNDDNNDDDGDDDDDDTDMKPAANNDGGDDDDDDDDVDDDTDMKPAADDDSGDNDDDTDMKPAANNDGGGDDDNEDKVSIEYILENSSDLIDTLEFFKQNIENLLSNDSLDEEKKAFLRLNVKYIPIFDLIKTFILTALSDDTPLLKVPYYLILVKILFKYILVAITNEKDKEKFKKTSENFIIISDNRKDDPKDVSSASNITGQNRALSQQTGTPVSDDDNDDLTDDSYAKANDMLAPKGDGSGASSATAMDIDDDDAHNKKVLAYSPAKGNVTSTHSPGRQRGSISEPDGGEYPGVDFDEYLKLRLGKLIEVSNYVSSSAQNLDNTSNILEGAFALERKFPQLKQTQKKLATKTSTEAKMGIKVYDKKYQTVNANSRELVVGLDRSLEIGCYQGEQREGVSSAITIQQLRVKNKEQQAEIERLREQLAELSASSNAKKPLKRDQKGKPKRKPIRLRRTKSDGEASSSATQAQARPATLTSTSDQTNTTTTDSKSKRRKK